MADAIMALQNRRIWESRGVVRFWGGRRCGRRRNLGDEFRFRRARLGSHGEQEMGEVDLAWKM